MPRQRIAVVGLYIVHWPCAVDSCSTEDFPVLFSGSMRLVEAASAAHIVTVNARGRSSVKAESAGMAALTVHVALEVEFSLLCDRDCMISGIKK